jgi:aspartate/methionine/tyrosine aminotransferase
VEARQAIANYYAEQGLNIDPWHILLAASTSELYAQLFWLLADHGDKVLTPQPGYPLFEFIGDLAGLERIPYPLSYDGTWYLDQEGVSSAASSNGARILVAVSPSNPTGHYLKHEEYALLQDLCAERELGLIVDEVFSDYPLKENPHPCKPLAGDLPALTFVLSGLSKVAALPQVKLSWAVVAGPTLMVEEAISRWELVSDTFLNLSTPAQQALPQYLEAGKELRPRILERCQTNLALAKEMTADSPVSILDVEGGWTALLRLPVVHGWSDQDWALKFLNEKKVAVQPGYYFDFTAESGPPIEAISLLTEPTMMSEGLSRLLDVVSNHS